MLVWSMLRSAGDPDLIARLGDAQGVVQIREGIIPDHASVDAKRLGPHVSNLLGMGA